MTARRQHAIPFVDLAATMAHGQVLDDAHGDDEVEGAVGPGQPAGRRLVQVTHLAHGAEVQLLDFRARELDECGVGIEGADHGRLGLLGQILGHVAEGAADLQHAQSARAARAQVGEQGPQKQRAARVLEVEVQRRAMGALAVDQQADHASAVARGVGAAPCFEDAAVAEVDDPERLRHPR